MTKKKLVHRILFAIWPLVILSCNMKVSELLNNKTKVPKDPNVYKNKEKFDISLLATIDTGVVYEEYSTEKMMLERLDLSSSTKKRYLVYKFYPNGCFNVFSFEKIGLPSPKELDPEYAGVRGIYYTEDNQIRYDYFSAIDQKGNVGKISGTIIVKNDTLFLKRDNRRGIDAESYPIRVVTKRDLPPQYFTYRANW